MDFRNTLSVLLPPPRDDEPASLRRDIVDELSDHLVSAYHRELLRGVDSNVARQRVLEQFGDPAAMARRLWFDAMKGKIMMQRVLIASCVVVTAASLTLVGLTWRHVTMGQRDAVSAVAAAMQAMALQNAKAQATQQQMLKQMREMSEAIRASRSLEWNPVTFKVTEETPDGPPIAGVSIALNERVVGTGGLGMGQAAQKPTLHLTDASGVADFGVVRPGDYFYRVFKDWDQEYLVTSGELRIEPGSQLNQRIVCPKTPLQRVPVRVRATWPADLERENLVLYASFAFTPIQRDGRSWTLCDTRTSGALAGRQFSSLASRTWPANRTVLCGPAKSMVQVLPTKTLSFWTLSGRPQPTISADIRGTDVREITEPTSAMEWERGTYDLSGLVVLRPNQPAGASAGSRRFEMLFTSVSRSGNLSLNYFVLDKPPAVEGVDGIRAGGTQRKAARAVTPPGTRVPVGFQESVPWDSWSVGRAPFAARPGQNNEFTISLPDEVLNVVREKLKAASTAP
jgi:hypothetical protein